MSVGCDRPYPFFSADIEEIKYLIDENTWAKVDLGLLFLAYESIGAIYDSAKALIADKNGNWKARMTPKERRLQIALLNYYDRCDMANYCVDLQEEKLRKKRDAPPSQKGRRAQ